jgi:DNA-directed RNA polymerase specialized sigma24 family protein
MSAAHAIDIWASYEAPKLHIIQGDYRRSDAPLLPVIDHTVKDESRWKWRQRDEPHREDVAIWSWRQIDEERLETSLRQMQRAHTMYLKGAMTLDNYSLELLKFLAGERRSSGAYAYLETIAASLETKTFSKPKSFAQNLRDGFKYYCRYNRLAAPTTKMGILEVTEGSAIAPGLTSERNSGNKLADIKYEENKHDIKQAYCRFAARHSMKYPEHAEHDFLETVTKFAKGKIEQGIFDLPEWVKTADDYSQLVADKVRRGVDKVTGGPSGFFAWLTTVCKTVSIDAFKEVKDQTDRKVDFMVEVEDENGEKEWVQNPIVTNLFEYDEGTGMVDLDRKELPTWDINGEDGVIVKRLNEGVSCAKIAKELGLNPATVRKRKERLFDKARWGKPLEM